MLNIYDVMNLFQLVEEEAVMYVHNQLVSYQQCIIIYTVELVSMIMTCQLFVCFSIISLNTYQNAVIDDVLHFEV